MECSPDTGDDAQEARCRTSYGSCLPFFSTTIQSASQVIIRPPRAQYSVDQLGPEEFLIGSEMFCRADIELCNHRGHALQCSLFTRADGDPEGRKPRPCVIFLHGNSSCRAEALVLLRLLLPRGVSLFCLDLAGSGLSGGEYVSLGHFEEQDVAVAIDHLRSTGKATSIALWGRSMGAATAALCAGQDTKLAACVLDSAFACLRKLCTEHLDSLKIPLPSFLLHAMLDMVRDEVLAEGGFDMYEVRPVDAAAAATCSVIIAVADEDKLVPPHHGEELYEAWSGSDRHFLHFPGPHGGARPASFLELAADFVASRCQSWESAQHLDERLRSPCRPLGLARSSPCAPARTAPASSSSTARQRDVVHCPDAPAPAAPAAASSAAVAQRESSVFQELKTMGFEEASAAEATEQCSSVESAVGWMLRPAEDAFSALRNKLQAEATAAPLAHVLHATVEPGCHPKASGASPDTKYAPLQAACLQSPEDLCVDAAARTLGTKFVPPQAPRVRSQVHLLNEFLTSANLETTKPASPQAGRLQSQVDLLREGSAATLDAKLAPPPAAHDGPGVDALGDTSAPTRAFGRHVPAPQAHPTSDAPCAGRLQELCEQSLEVCEDIWEGVECLAGASTGLIFPQGPQIFGGRAPEMQAPTEAPSPSDARFSALRPASSAGLFF